MKNTNKTATAFLFFLFCLSLFAYASCSITSVSASSSASRVTTGTSVTITVTYSGSECTSETVYLLSSGGSGGLTVSDPSSGYYSGVSSGSSKTFTVTASTAGTYQYWGMVSTSESTKGTLVYEAPSVISVSGTPTSSIVTQGTSVKLNVTLTNPGAALTTSYRLVVSDTGSLSVSGDPVNSVTSLSMGASSSTTLQWTISVPTYFSTSKTAVLELGSDSDSFTSTITSACPSGYTVCNGACAASCPSSSSSSTTTTTTTTGGTPLGGGNPEPELETLTTESGQIISYSRTLDSDPTGGSSTVTLLIKNEQTTALTNFEYRERIPSNFAGSISELAFSLQPTRFEEGSIIAVWVIEKLEPGESIAIAYTVDRLVNSLVGFSAEVKTITTPQTTAPAGGLQKLTISGIKNAKVGEKITLTLAKAGASASGVSLKITTPLGKVLTLVSNAQGKVEFNVSDAGVYRYSADGYIIEGISSTTVTGGAGAVPILPQSPAEQTPQGGTASSAPSVLGLAALCSLPIMALIGLAVLAVIAYYYMKGKKRRGV